MNCNERKKELQGSMNVGFGARLTAFVFAFVLMAIISLVVMQIVVHKGVTTPRLRVATVLQDVLMFIIPALVAAVIACRLPARLLLLNRLRCPLPAILLVFAAMVFSIPAMNWLVELNKQMALPDWLEPVQQWMKSTEESAAASVSTLLGGTSVADLLMSILIVGLLAGFSEEIFFRGGLQQILMTRPMNPHAAIWITALVFSAFHMQFYGFLPRLLLGVWFGYLAWWSQSLWLPVTAHVLNNCAVVVSGWLVRRQTVTTDIDTIGADGSPLLVAASVVLTVLTVWGMWWLLKSVNRNSCA